MTAITIVIIGFVILEASNVIALYFFPESKYANGVGTFRAFERSKQDPVVHDFVRYLVNWVAGTLHGRDRHAGPHRYRCGRGHQLVLLAVVAAGAPHGRGGADRPARLLEGAGRDDRRDGAGVRRGHRDHVAVVPGIDGTRRQAAIDSVDQPRRCSSAAAATRETTAHAAHDYNDQAGRQLSPDQAPIRRSHASGAWERPSIVGSMPHGTRRCAAWSM